MQTAPFRPLAGALVTLLLLAVPVVAQEKPTLTPDDYGKWESFGFADLSPDGRWLAVPTSRVNDEDELRIHRIGSDSIVVVPYGTQAEFSDDGRWAAWVIGHSEKERDAAQKASRTLRSRLAVMDLASGDITTIDAIASFSFSGDSRFLAMRGYPAKDQKHRGVDVIVRDLATGTHATFGDVAEQEWQEEGSLLAMVVDAETKAANGVKLYDPATGVLRTLVSDTAGFKGMQWRDDSADLAVFGIRNDTTREGPTHLIHAWTGLAGRNPVHSVLDPAAMQGFPPDARVVDFRSLSWARDGSRVLFGIQDWEMKEKPDSAKNGDDDETPGVEIWHAADVDIMPEQKVRATRDRQLNHVSAWNLADNRFIQIANELTENASPARIGPYASATDQTPYEADRMFGPVYNDVYVVDLNTGERTLVKERVQFNYGASPSGRYVLYLENDHYWVYDVTKQTHTNITQNVATSFIDIEDDHTVEQKPPFGNAGWTTNDATVLLYDKYDVWEVAPDGSKATRLTDGHEDAVRYRLVFLDPDMIQRDMSRPQYAALYGEKTKQYGYGIVQRGKAPVRSVMLDRNVGRLVKAKGADVYSYFVQAFDDSPDYFVGGESLGDAVQVTNSNPFMADYAWSPRTELLDFENRRGAPLQAALHYPANWEPGRQYPMIVYIYEIVSNQAHSYSVPSEESAYNPTIWTQQGYFVLRPDIVYYDRDPGVSAVDALVPAVERAVAAANIDPARVGLVGHSWGGYQTAFASTVTNTFAAGVAGAPLTEMASMYLSVYWNSGSTDARIFEISQGRMEVPPWKDLESYTRNSAVWNIETMETPLLMAFGDEDGAVDWHQGIVLYNAARRENKDLVMLVYEGENHSLAKKPNRLDYHRRVNAWFAHYLKGEPAPDWMTKGVKFLDKDKQITRITADGVSSDGGY
jgi:dipeptidyl aminopeptidase/acylaminoacyl peptidase